jgi:hypothetical protein
MRVEITTSSISLELSIDEFKHLQYEKIQEAFFKTIRSLSDEFEKNRVDVVVNK